MPVVIKIAFESDVRRVLLDTEDATYEDVCKAVSQLYPDLTGCTAKYVDEEGDACTLCAASFPDLLAVSAANDSKGNVQRKLLLKLKLFRPAPTPNARLSAVPDATSAPPADCEALQRHLDLLLKGLGQAMQQHVAGGSDGRQLAVHWGITCDACNKHPIEGPRFKCRSCPDFDLCSSCFGERAEAHGGPCADHEFDRLDADAHWPGPCPMGGPMGWAMKGLLKGFCKGKDKGRGKFSKGKGKNREGEPSERSAAAEPGAVGEGAQIGPSVSALLSPRALAGVATVMLPKALSCVASLEPEALGRHLLAALGHLPELRAAFERLQPLLAPAGLGHIEELLGALLSEGAAPDAAGQFLLALLTGLDALPFDDRIRLLEELFSSQEKRLAELFGRAEMRLPFLSGMLEHRSITCDGCGASPIKGPRFRCDACADYDLCAECFAKKTELHGGPCAEHQFRCEVANWRSLHQARPAWMELLGKGVLKGTKGMMKGLLGKGMRKGKGKHQPGWGEGRACARPECNFQATWHWTHCCAACAAGLGHGVCCERKDSERLPSSPADQHSDGNIQLSKTVDPASMTPSSDPAEGASVTSADDTNMEDKAAAEPEEPAVEPKATEEQPKMTAPRVRACARPECHFQATWHATHCCAACAKGKGHGQRCEHKAQPQPGGQAGEEVPEAPAAKLEAKAPLGTQNAKAACDEAALAERPLSFHVVVDDGRRLLLEWQSGVDASEAAWGFATQHGLGEEQVPQLVAAMRSAERGGGRTTDEEGKAPAGPAPGAADGREAAAEAPDPFQEQISRIEDLRALLQALGGNLQQAVEVLMAHVQQ